MEKRFYQEYALKDGRSLIIRSADGEDYQGYSELLHRCGRETDNLSFGADDCPYSEKYCRAYLNSLAEKPNSFCLLAFVEGELVGEVSLSAQLRRCSHTAELGICILQKYCGIGIGRILMEEAMEIARSGGTLRSIFLSVDSFNEVGIHLYTRCGFKEYGRYRDYVSVNGNFHDVLFMNYYF
ncbi:MAG: GNAT family N-acetyltransferase [Bacillota bacterium]|nr:GNAT family N-acetyltransferase [Bacillota bacterium]